MESKNPNPGNPIVGASIPAQTKNESPKCPREPKREEKKSHGKKKRRTVYIKKNASAPD